MVERWRQLPSALQDAVLAVAFAAVWFGAFDYLGDQGWRPVRPDAYLLAGWWSAAVLLLRRVAPLSVLLVTVSVYPLAYQATLQTEFHLLPILLAGYTATTAGRARSVAVAGAAMVAVFVLSVGGPRVEWDRILVNEFAMASTVFLGALLHEQRRTAAVLAERNAELERLRAVEAEQAIVEERARIARELHDVVAHHLTAVIVRAQAADRVAATNPAEGAETLRWVVGTAREALTSMRDTVRVLRDDAPDLAPGPSLGDLPGIAGRMQAVGLDVSLVVAPGLPVLGPQTELAAVRIAQEALTNVLRHAHARRAVVSLQLADEGLVLSIDDDGDGTAPVPGRIRGHGLLGMRERATSCGGDLRLGPSRLGGWRVWAWLPVASPAVAP